MIRPEPAEIAPVQLTIAARGGAAAAAEAAPVSPAKQPEPTKLPPLKQPPVFLEDKEFDNIDAEAMDGEWYVPTMEEDDDDFSISSSRSSSKVRVSGAMQLPDHSIWTHVFRRTIHSFAHSHRSVLCCMCRPNGRLQTPRRPGLCCAKKRFFFWFCSCLTVLLCCSNRKKAAASAARPNTNKVVLRP